MATIKNFEELIERSIKIEKSIRITYPQFEKEEVFVPKYDAKFNGTFCVNNSTLAFLDKMVLYVTPLTNAALSYLKNEGFSEQYFFVPFSNGDYPTHTKSRWESLRRMAEKEWEQEFAERCIAYCEADEVGELLKDVLDNCLEIPKYGVRIKTTFGCEDTQYPIIMNQIIDSETRSRLGCFCKNNGRVVFVYRDGRTFVAKGYGILKHLQATGYEEAGLFVPFSNSEQILDRNIAAKWDSLTKF